jgi:hypothetical protein
MAEAPTTEQISSIMRRLEAKASLTEEEVGALQQHIDLLESRVSKSHHDTSSHHHTSTFVDPLLPEQIAQFGREQG